MVDQLEARGTRFRARTTRSHICLKMCADAPGNHARVYDDLERAGAGTYRLRTADS